MELPAVLTAEEALSELCRSMIYNLSRIEMTLAVWRDQSQEEGEPEVEGSGEAEESGDWAEDTGKRGLFSTWEYALESG